MNVSTNLTIAHQAWYLTGLGIWMVLLFGLSALAQPIPKVSQIPAFLPVSTTVPRTQPIPVDGAWSISSRGERIRREADRSRVVGHSGMDVTVTDMRYRSIPVNLDNHGWQQQEMQHVGIISAHSQVGYSSAPTYTIAPPGTGAEQYPLAFRSPLSE